MIPFRVIRSGVLLGGLLAALTSLAPAAVAGFTAKLSDEQKAEAGLNGFTNSELSALDHLVAIDIARGRTTPALTDPYSERYSAAETKEAGLDRLSPEQLAKLDGLIAAAVAAAPKRPQVQPRERPRLRGDEILSEKGRLQVHGGFSLTYGWAGGGRNFRGTGAWVSYFDPVTGLGLTFGYSRYSGDMFGGYYGGNYGNYYADAAYVFPASRPAYVGYERTPFDRNEFIANDAVLGNSSMLSAPSRGFRR
ncbi:MAG TPA: hypothetical protein VG734_12260 [Lacunisphaera sp.]|nr:hypothetical protein [Lacunisphaera sp.]